MKNSLTSRQQKIFEYIREGIQGQGCPPTVREICDRFGIASPRGVSDHLAALEKKGYIERTPNKSRGIRLVMDPFEEALEKGIPIVGTVAAGHPILAEQHIHGTLSFDNLFGNNDLMAIVVKGDSMVECGIMDGDYVIVRRRSNFENGAIAVAYIDGEATVKKVYKTRTGYLLQPENRDFDPITVDATTPDFQIAGPVVGVVRSI